MSMPKMIGFCGKKTVGKTTAANMFQKRTDWSIVESLATPIKNSFHMNLLLGKHVLLNMKYEFSKEEMRPVYQAIGKMCRNKSRTFFVKYLKESMRLGYFQAYRVIIIDDVRFQEESDFIKENGGIIIKIIGDHPNMVLDDDKDESENQEIIYDYEILNTGKLEDLETKIKYIYQEIK